MTKYTINIVLYEDVEAENEEEAYAKANALIDEGDYTLQIIDTQEVAA